MLVVVHSTFRTAIKRIRQRFRDRGLEWEHSTMTLLFGLILLGNPSVFEGPGFVAFPGSAYLWGSLVTLIGLLRIGALCVNGYMARPTALIRAFAALLGILLFAALSLGFLFSWRWGTALSMYPVVGFYGLFSLYWAIFDVAVPDHHDDAT